jgi:acetyl-CoA synthetase
MIKARIPAQNPNANLPSYADACRDFSWNSPEVSPAYPMDGGINIVREAIDRWADDPGTKDRPALLFEKGSGIQAFSYLQLKEASSRWAHLFKEQGFQERDRFFIFLPPCPEIYFAMLACARLGVVFCPVFANLGYDELAVRLTNARPIGILTHPDLVERIPSDIPGAPGHLFLTEGPLPGRFPGEMIGPEAAAEMPEDFPALPLPQDSPLYLNYTSGSTGPPKGIVHAHRDMVAIKVTARSVLDLSEGTTLWTDADPAWVNGTVYGTFGPWLCGAVSVVQGGPFRPSGCYWTLERHRVAVWYTTPRTIRELMEAGEDLPKRYDLSHLRHIATVGAPLAPDLFYWVRKHLGLSPHDTWWMTETGMICIANFPSMDIKPGAMGKQVPGVRTAILDESGHPLPAMSLGELAVKADLPNMMTGMWEDKSRYQDYFRVKGWMLTGDMAIMDEEGYIYHQGRNDDLIKSGGGQVVGPYEIENVLAMHPAVAEAAVIAMGREPGKGVSYLKAFIVLNPGPTPSVRLGMEIKAFVKANLAQDVIVQEVAFMDDLPRTRSGKLLRRILRARELGLPG